MDVEWRDPWEEWEKTEPPKETEIREFGEKLENLCNLIISVFGVFLSVALLVLGFVLTADLWSSATSMSVIFGMLWLPIIMVIVVGICYWIHKRIKLL